MIESMKLDSLGLMDSQRQKDCEKVAGDTEGEKAHFFPNANFFERLLFRSFASINQRQCDLKRVSISCIILRVREHFPCSASNRFDIMFYRSSS